MLKPAVIDPFIKAALKEDIGAKDITTSALMSKNLQIKAGIRFKQSGVLCGIEVAERVFRLVGDNIRFLPVAKDGEWIEKGREVAYIEGPAAAILIGERTALNFMAHMSGIATKTHYFVERIKNTSAKVYDTRKTTPNLRVFEKYAVKTGGGTNHRQGLYDQVLIKDNHLRILKSMPIPDAVASIRKSVLKKTVIGIEVKNLLELKEALKSKAHYILLDNMTPELVKEAVEMRKTAKSNIAFEVSGGIHIDNIIDYAKTGVERISVGALTHSVPAIDISLDIVNLK